MTSGRLSDSAKGSAGESRWWRNDARPKMEPSMATNVVTARPRISQNPHDGFSPRRLPSSGDGETKGGSGSGGKTGIGFSGKDTGSTMLWFQCTRDEIAQRMASIGHAYAGRYHPG